VVGGGVVGWAGAATVTAPARGRSRARQLPVLPLPDTLTVITTKEPGVALPTRNLSVRVPLPLARMAAPPPCSHASGPLAVTCAFATVRTRIFAIVWSAGRQTTALARHTRLDVARTAGVAAGRGVGSAVAELPLFEPLPFAQPAMAANSATIATEPDQAGWRIGQARWPD
jgi:hypothetical protein